MIQRKNFEILDQAHQMYAEGAESLEMDNNDIVQALLKEGWECSEIEINFDNMQQLWRWTCDIKRMNHTDIKDMFTKHEIEGYTFYNMKHPDAP